jgi:hypothetical protein
MRRTNNVVDSVYGQYIYRYEDDSDEEPCFFRPDPEDQASPETILLCAEFVMHRKSLLARQREKGSMCLSEGWSFRHALQPAKRSFQKVEPVQLCSMCPQGAHRKCVACARQTRRALPLRRLTCQVQGSIALQRVWATFQSFYQASSKRKICRDRAKLARKKGSKRSVALSSNAKGFLAGSSEPKFRHRA